MALAIQLTFPGARGLIIGYDYFVPGKVASATPLFGSAVAAELRRWTAVQIMESKPPKTFYLDTVTYIKESNEVILEHVTDLHTRTKCARFVFKQVTNFQRRPMQQYEDETPYESLLVIDGNGPSLDRNHHHFIEHNGEEITFVSPVSPIVTWY